ncbi:hypothetical protein LRR80_05209 [Streptomyces sp. RO-S4]|nr:hypothetical protein [Streptomyces sp. RO-S4]
MECSEKASGAAIQEIWGSFPALTSARRWSKYPSPLLTSVPVRALSYQGSPGRALRYLSKYSRGVVAVVAAVGVLDPAPGAGRVQAVADVLVDLPGDAGLLQALGVGGPAVAEFGVVQNRAAAAAVVARVAGPHVVAVRVGGADERAVVGVADGEGVGEGEVEGDVLAGQVRHGRGALGGHPPVVLAAVVSLLTVRPGVRQALQELHAEVVGVRVEGQELLSVLLLVPDRFAVAEADRAGVAEAADASQGAEVVVEGAVLLHEDDDVLDVLDRPGAVVRRQGGGALDAGGQGAEGRGGTRELEKAAPVDF